MHTNTQRSRCICIEKLHHSLTFLYAGNNGSYGHCYTHKNSAYNEENI